MPVPTKTSERCWAKLRTKVGAAERDFITLGILTAAIIMFAGTGGVVFSQIARSFAGIGGGADKALVNALLLNIALIIFGWRRYRQLREEVDVRRRAEEAAHHMAATDPLTGLLNRRAFNAALGNMVEEAVTPFPPVCVIMIDLDNFKRINDLKGHAVGDRALVESSRRVLDLLPPNALLARIGGDEFAAALQIDTHRIDAVEDIAARVLEELKRPIDAVGTQVEVTASIGLVRADIDYGPLAGNIAQDPSRLVELADIAMYHAKNQGRNGYFWFEQKMADEMRYRADMERGIRLGIERGEFVPYYERQIDLETGELTGFEMLARWQSPQFGLVKPDLFIPIAEEIGLIGELSECLIEQALADARDWDPALTLAVNISPLQLRDPWFSQRLIKLLTRANFPPQRLEIEIAEACIHDNLAGVKTLAASLRNQGIRISLDDFGTGYSSLAHLSHLAFDRIKIDKSFVMTMSDDTDNAAIVQAIARFGEELDLPITAEGVESGAVLEKLREMGRIKGQGYLYGEPRPASEIGSWLAAHGILANEVEPDTLRQAGHG